MMAYTAFHGSEEAMVSFGSATERDSQATILKHRVEHTCAIKYQFHPHWHPFVSQLVSRLVTSGLAGLQAADTEFKETPLANGKVHLQPVLYEDFFSERYRPVTTNQTQAFVDAVDGQGNAYPAKQLDFDGKGGYSVYNWELFYHVPLTIAVNLSRNQRFAEAQRWFQFIFDPTDASDEPEPERFWKVLPLRIHDVKQIEEILMSLSSTAEGAQAKLKEQTLASLETWRKDPFRPHLVARMRPSAHMYKAVMAYLDNLISWGDSLFRQDTRESINEALQLYVMAANILGPRPEEIPSRGTAKPQTYSGLLAGSLDEFANALCDIEADLPFDIAPPAGAGGQAGTIIASIAECPYFGVPKNDKLLGYWSQVADRLFKIRNSMNLQGVFRQQALLAPPIDPGVLASAAAAGVDVGALVAGGGPQLAPVRFALLLQRALEVCQEVKSLGAQALSALEKEDNEALAVLRARHEASLLGLGETVKFSQWKETEKTLEGIRIGLENAFQRYCYYERLLGRKAEDIKRPEYDSLDVDALDTLPGRQPRFSAEEPALVAAEPKVEIGSSFRDGGHKVSPAEAHEITLAEAAQIVADSGTVLEGIGAVLNLIPEFEANGSPLGVGVTVVATGGTKFGHMFQGLASATRGVAARVQHEASLAGKMAAFDRREQDWAFQRQLAAGEVTQLYKQYRTAEIRAFIAKREYANHKEQIAQAKDIEDFLTNEKRKKSSQDLYLWMKRELKGLYSQYFQFAYDVAKRAERALQYELGDESASFIHSSYLEGREGFLAGEKLQLDLKRLEMAYLDRNRRTLELVKHVSLREWFPRALIALRSSSHAQCEIELPEALFDLDCPGHSFRRLKSVALSIPCITGPYVSVNCRLTLLQSYLRRGQDGYGVPDPGQDPTNFISYPAVVESVVTSSTLGDTGMFETNLHDDRVLPFEGAGAISRWSLELLGDPRPFDYDSIADVVLTLRYTALSEGNEVKAKAAAKSWLETNSSQAFSMRHEFPDEWARFRSTVLKAGGKAELPFELTVEHYPYRVREMPKANAMRLFIKGTAKGKVELFHAGKSLGSGSLSNDMPLGTEPFDSIGLFTLVFEDNRLDDLILLVERSPDAKRSNGVRASTKVTTSLPPRRIR